jgi:hypothetical protein
VTGAVSGVYAAGTVLDLRAEADPGYRFVAWFVNDRLAGNDVDLSLTVDGDKEVEAVFARQCVLTVLDGSGGGVYDQGTDVEIVAQCPPEFFAGWTGDVATVADVSSPTTTVTVEGDLTVTATTTSRLAIETRTEEDLGWVYQNTPGCLARGGHAVALEVVVLEAAGNARIDLEVAKEPHSGPGEVTVHDDPLGRPMVRRIVGSMRTDGQAGAGGLVLTVTAAGDVWGRATATVPFVVRRLGDIDGNGGPEPTDMALMILRLNGQPTPGIHPRAFDLDANGGPEPGDMAILINILNGMPVG